MREKGVGREGIRRERGKSIRKTKDFRGRKGLLGFSKELFEPFCHWGPYIHDSFFCLQTLAWPSGCILPYVTPCCINSGSLFLFVCLFFWLCPVPRDSIFQAVFLFHFLFFKKIKTYFYLWVCVYLSVSLWLSAIYVQALEEARRGPQLAAAAAGIQSLAQVAVSGLSPRLQASDLVLCYNASRDWWHLCSTTVMFCADNK